MSETYAMLRVSPECYREIRSHLATAGYTHAFDTEGRINMHGLAIASDGSDQCRPEMGCGPRRRSDRIREINDWSEQPATDIVAALAFLCEEVEELGRRVRESTAAAGRIG